MPVHLLAPSLLCPGTPVAQSKPHKRLFSAPAHRLGEFGQSHPVVWNTFFLGLVLTRPKEALAYDAAPPPRAGPLGIGDLKKALKQGLGCFSYGRGAWLSLLRANTGAAGGREWGQAGPILSHKYSQFSIPREKRALLVNGVDFIILLYCLWPISQSRKERDQPGWFGSRRWEEVIWGQKDSLLSLRISGQLGQQRDHPSPCRSSSCHSYPPNMCGPLASSSLQLACAESHPCVGFLASRVDTPEITVSAKAL